MCKERWQCLPTDEAMLGHKKDRHNPAVHLGRPVADKARHCCIGEGLGQRLSLSVEIPGFGEDLLDSLLYKRNHKGVSRNSQYISFPPDNPCQPANPSVTWVCRFSRFWSSVREGSAQAKPQLKWGLKPGLGSRVSLKPLRGFGRLLRRKMPILDFHQTRARV